MKRGQTKRNRALRVNRKYYRDVPQRFWWQVSEEMYRGLVALGYLKQRKK
jgi:hypothetical protein